LGSDQIPAPLLGDTFSASEFLKREKLVVAMRKTKSDDLLQQTEQALRESDECLQSILSSIDEVVWSAAPDGMQIHYINPALEHIWGLNGGYSTKDGTAWMYRAGLESILGFQLTGARLRIDPSIPRGWREFEITYKHGRRGATRYHIKVENPHGVCRGIAKLEIDGKVQQSSEIVLADDAQLHDVRVILGEQDAA
jgi:PAS domain-containing protein